MKIDLSVSFAYCSEEIRSRILRHDASFVNGKVFFRVAKVFFEVTDDDEGIMILT